MYENVIHKKRGARSINHSVKKYFILGGFYHHQTVIDNTSLRKDQILIG